MDILLTPLEARVLGVLLEKEKTTPEYYPLTLNSILDACNQKTNRDPVMSLNDRQVTDTLKSLIAKHLVWEKNVIGSRAIKYAHRLSNTLTRAFDFSPSELAILCLLLLRGPQTSGELRTRAGRMANFNNVDDVEKALQQLMHKDGGPYVAELNRQPGQREARFIQLFTGPADQEISEIGAEETPTRQGRLSDLEQEVALLRQEVNYIMEELHKFKEKN